MVSRGLPAFMESRSGQWEPPLLTLSSCSHSLPQLSENLAEDTLLGTPGEQDGGPLSIRSPLGLAPDPLETFNSLTPVQVRNPAL